MKKIILLITLALGYSSYAQETAKPPEESSSSSIIDEKHEVKLGAIKLIAGGIVEGTYEYIYNEDFTFGASVLGNLDSGGNDYPENFSITPFARFYFNESREYGAKGFFVEGFAKYMTGKQTTYYYDGNGTEYDVKQNFSGGAAGISLGWKWINHSGFVFELLVGGGRVFSSDDNAPDAVFRGDFNLGYRF
jgi:hypothetical protein